MIKVKNKLEKKNSKNIIRKTAKTNNKNIQFNIVICVTLLLISISIIYLIINRNSINFRSLLGASSINTPDVNIPTIDLIEGKTYYYSDYGFDTYKLQNIKNNTTGELEENSCYVTYANGNETTNLTCSNSPEELFVYAKKKGVYKVFFNKKNYELKEYKEYHIIVIVTQAKVDYEITSYKNIDYYTIKNSNKFQNEIQTSGLIQCEGNYDDNLSLNMSVIYASGIYNYLNYKSNAINIIDENKTLSINKGYIIPLVEDQNNYIKSKTFNDENELLITVYNSLLKKKPVILQTITKNNTKHYVTIIGFRKGITRDIIKTTDFLILDSCHGYINNLGDGINPRHIAKGTDFCWYLDNEHCNYNYQIYTLEN